MSIPRVLPAVASGDAFECSARWKSYCPALESRIDCAALPFGLLRVKLTPDARSYGSISSAMRFIQYCSFPLVT